MSKYNSDEERKFASNERAKLWYQNHKEKQKLYSRDRYQNNALMKKRQLAQQKERYHLDDVYKQNQKNCKRNKIALLNKRIKELEGF